MGSNILTEERKNLYKEIIEFYNSHDISKKECSDHFNIPYPTVLDILRKGNVSTRKVHQFNESYFKLIDSHDKAYWLGFILADGTIDLKRLKITLSRKDHNHLAKFMQTIGSNGSIKLDKTVVNKKTIDLSTIRFDSPELISDLNNKDIFPVKSTNEIPYYEIDKEFIYSYILGIYDGDGWLNFNNNSREFGICNSLEVCQFIKNILEENLNVTGNKIKLNNSKKENSLYRYRITRKKDIEIVLDKLYSESLIYLDRKLINFQEYKTTLI